jgi:hypothetical protein
MSGTIRTVTLNGRTFDLRYDFAFSARAIRMLAPNGSRRELMEIVMSGEVEDICVVLAAGINEVHEAKAKQRMQGIRNFVEDVVEWLDDARTAGRDIMQEIIMPMRRAVGESGICGWARFTVDEDGNVLMEDGVLGKAGGGTVKAAE